ELNLHSNGSDTLHKESEEELSWLLEDATRIRLRSDVPVGVFLSGGIDSGLTAAFAARQSAAQKPLALTVSFQEEDYDETDYATATARHCGLPQQVIRQEPAGLAMIDELAWYYDEPFGDASALPTYQLCKTAARYATVFLSGDGGDEIFGGYRRYVEAKRYSSLERTLRPFKWMGMPLFKQLAPFSQVRYKAAKMWLPDEGFAAVFDGAPNDPVLKLLAGEYLEGQMQDAGKSIWQRWNAQPNGNLLARQQQLEIDHYLPDDILVKMDRASMAHSIEVRSPFLDYRVAEWAAKLPRNLLLNGASGKLPLRALAAKLLPRKVGQGVKKGFGVPLDAWFRQKAGKDFAVERLLSRQALERGWWKGKTVKKMIALHQTNKGRQFGGLIWRLLML
ncbi:MAG: asparagine synthase-related protein, partial [Bacteroidota bacterium]